MSCGRYALAVLAEELGGLPDMGESWVRMRGPPSAIGRRPSRLRIGSSIVPVF